MANKNHLKILEKGVAIWNQWRRKEFKIRPDLTGADLTGANLAGVDLNGADLTGANLFRVHLNGANLYLANFVGANLSGANLTRAKLGGANLSGADLSGADLNEANFSGANLSEGNLSKAKLVASYFCGTDLRGANLSGANLCRAYLIEANLYGANLSGADLSGANLSEVDLSESIIIYVNLKGATLAGCRVFGISAWELEGLEEAKQNNLVITPCGHPIITVDNLEVAQFIYLLLHSKKVRSVIDTTTSKLVLILGRFTPERKAILEAIRMELRKHNYLPILFDFEVPSSRDITETVSILAHMARFIIADLTDAKSVPQELKRIIPNLPSVPVQPILLASDREYSMFEHFKRYSWVLKTQRYNDLEDLLKSLSYKVIQPAENKAKQLRRKRISGFNHIF